MNPVGDEALGSVQDPLVAVKNSLGLLSLRIGSRARLGQTECAKLLSAGQIRKILHLLLFGSEGKDRIHAERGMSGNNNAGGAADLGQLLYAHCIGENIRALAAVLLRDRNTHEAVTCHLLDGLDGELLSLIYLLSKRLDFVFSELSEKRTGHSVFLV